MAGSLMTRELRSFSLDEPLPQVQAILLRHRISQLAVVAADGHVMGCVTHRSLLRALSQRGPGDAGGFAAAGRPRLRLPSVAFWQPVHHAAGPDGEAL